MRAPDRHLWWTCGRLHFVPTDAHRVRELVADASAAVRQVSYGIAPNDAVHEAVRLFGFKRAGRNIVEHFRSVLDQLVQDGSLVQDGGFLRLPGTTG